MGEHMFLTVKRRSCCALTLGLASFVAGCAEPAQPSATPAESAKVDVWTYHNDNARTGLNDRETVLTPALLRGDGPGGKVFGELWSVAVDGQRQVVLVRGRRCGQRVVRSTRAE